MVAGALCGDGLVGRSGLTIALNHDQCPGVLPRGDHYCQTEPHSLFLGMPKDQLVLAFDMRCEVSRLSSVEQCHRSVGVDSVGYEVSAG